MVADERLSQFTLEKGAEVIILSEQYRDRDCATWFVDDLGTAAIWIRDPGSVPVESHGAGQGFVWAKSRDVTYVSCYLSPNDSSRAFREKLEALEDSPRNMEGGLIVGGDFNARAVEWGMPRPNSTGNALMEMTSRLGLVVLNTGTAPTYRRSGFGESIPDVTFASEALVCRAKGWKMMADYTGSDHSYITFSLIPHRSPQYGRIQPPTRLEHDALRRGEVRYKPEERP